MARGVLTLWLAALISLPASIHAGTPAEQKIAAARQAIALGKPTAQNYNDLALAFAKRARETADPDFYVQAEEALKESFRLAPDNFDGLKTRVWLLLGKHEFAQAAKEAKSLNERTPDDLMVYAMLVDAHAELGNYAEAETAAQWLLDLRPGNIAGLCRAAYLREIFGDLEGSAELMMRAYDRTQLQEVEDRAWLLTHLAHLQRLMGHLDNADKLLAEALRLFPDYHYALGESARLRTDQNRSSEAVALFRKRYEVAPHPENLFDLAQALQRTGKRRDAKDAYRRFERAALAESSSWDNANRELILYYVDYKRDQRAALRLAEVEYARRKDVHTLDVYAWALYANRRGKEAKEQMEKALAVGSRDPRLLDHARRMGVLPAPSKNQEQTASKQPQKT